MTKILPQAKLCALQDEKKETEEIQQFPGDFFPLGLLCYAEVHHSHPRGKLTSIERRKSLLPLLSSAFKVCSPIIFSLLFVTMVSLRVEGSEVWKSHSQFSEFLTLKNLFPLFLKRDLAQIL